MRYLIVLLILALPLLTVSCGGNNPPPAEQHQQPDVAPIRASASSGNAIATPNASANASASGNGSAPVPPKDARFTILCTVVSGSDHVARANEVKSELLRTTRLNGWYVVHDQGRSIVYYGYYRSINDPQDPKENGRVQADL